MALNDLSVAYVNSSKLNTYPELLDRQFFKVKGSIKELFDIVLINPVYKTLCLLDNNHNVHEYYYLPQLPKIHCLINKNTMGQQKKEHYYLDPSVRNEEDIFWATDGSSSHVAVSLPIAEALLRRNPKEITLTALS